MERWAKGLNQKKEYVRDTEIISKWSKVESNSGGESQDGTPSSSDKTKVIIITNQVQINIFYSYFYFILQSKF